mmetsp:Transcript_12347/g.14111  ORF Transcript_12347/g.14111 Transcript_12347/m.14111 type:complete len:157 (+) Transcript_12347:1-471(+)
MYKLPGLKPRPSTSSNRNLLNRATSRKRIFRLKDGKDSLVKSRIIFNNKMVDNKKNLANPKNVLFSLKNFNLTSKNMNVKIVNVNVNKADSIYCDDGLDLRGRINKSFDDASKLAKRKNKIRKAKLAAKKQIINSPLNSANSYRIETLLKKEVEKH